MSETWWAKARRIICEECDDYDKHCTLDRRCSACYRKQPNAVCPAPTPKWGPVDPSAAPEAT